MDRMMKSKYWGQKKEKMQIFVWQLFDWQIRNLLSFPKCLVNFLLLSEIPIIFFSFGLNFLGHCDILKVGAIGESSADLKCIACVHFLLHPSIFSHQFVFFCILVSAFLAWNKALSTWQISFFYNWFACCHCVHSSCRS